MVILSQFSQITKTDNSKPKVSSTKSRQDSRLSSSYLSSAYDLTLMSHDDEAVHDSAAEGRIPEERYQSPEFSLANIRILPDSSQLKGNANPGWMPSAKPPVIWPIQAKLAINQPGDRYEEEADRVAEQWCICPILGPLEGRCLHSHPRFRGPAPGARRQASERRMKSGCR